jgi:hypothetical protein
MQAQMQVLQDHNIAESNYHQHQRLTIEFFDLPITQENDLWIHFTDDPSSFRPIACHK